MIYRAAILKTLKIALSRNRVVVLVGPRQCGKTTLARELLSEDSVNYFDLEDPTSLARLDEPMTALNPLKGLVVIDEVQRRPDLFPILRVLVDRKESPVRGKNTGLHMGHGRALRVPVAGLSGGRGDKDRNASERDRCVDTPDAISPVQPRG